MVIQVGGNMTGIEETFDDVGVEDAVHPRRDIQLVGLGNANEKQEKETRSYESILLCESCDLIFQKCEVFAFDQ